MGGCHFQILEMSFCKHVSARPCASVLSTSIWAQPRFTGRLGPRPGGSPFEKSMAGIAIFTSIDKSPWVISHCINFSSNLSTRQAPQTSTYHILKPPQLASWPMPSAAEEVDYVDFGIQRLKNGSNEGFTKPGHNFRGDSNLVIYFILPYQNGFHWLHWTVKVSGPRAPTMPGAPYGFATPFLKSTWMNRRLGRVSWLLLLTFKCDGIIFLFKWVTYRMILDNLGFWNDNRNLFCHFLFDLSYSCHHCTSIHVIYHYAKSKTSQKNVLLQSQETGSGRRSNSLPSNYSSKAIGKIHPNLQIGNKYVQFNILYV